MNDELPEIHQFSRKLAEMHQIRLHLMGNLDSRLQPITAVCHNSMTGLKLGKSSSQPV